MSAANWINPQLLSGERPIRVLAEEPGASRVFLIDDLLLPDKLRALRDIYADSESWPEALSVFRTSESGKVRTNARVEREEFEAASPEDRFWRFRQYRPAPGLSTERAMLLSLNVALTDEGLLKVLREVTGIALEPKVETAVLTMGRGDFQRPHNDVNPRRTLCGAFYLSEGWRPAFGGVFEMAVRGHVYLELEPRANRLVLFNPFEETGPELGQPEIPLHQVRPLTEAAGDWRRHSMSIWWTRASAG